MTPSLPTFFIASAMMLPIVGVAVGGDGADLGDHVAGDGLREACRERAAGHDLPSSSRVPMMASTALSMPRFRAIGLAPAATVFTPSRIDGLGQNGRGGGAVAGHVGGLGGDFAHHLRAHVLERILQLDFLGHGHAVLGDGGRAELLLDDDVAALGAERHLHRVGQRVHAAQNRLTGIFTVQNLLCHCPSSPDDCCAVDPRMQVQNLL